MKNLPYVGDSCVLHLSSGLVISGTRLDDATDGTVRVQSSGASRMRADVYHVDRAHVIAFSVAARIGDSPW